MIHVEFWPAPEGWEEIIVLWDDILKTEGKKPIREMLDWLGSTPGGCYHIHGFKSTEGFAFRFQDPKDATHFRLLWL